MSENDRDDFVGIVSGLTNYIQNERVRAYNEAVDMMLNSAREYLQMHDVVPQGKHLPELLDEVQAIGRRVPKCQCGSKVCVCS